jgi:hypothetical protein
MATDACEICNVAAAAAAATQRQTTPHYFVEFAARGPVRYFYTSPVRTMLIRTFEDFMSFKPHFDAVPGPFIFCIDCRGMEARHYPPLEVSKKIVKYIANEMPQMQGFWVINPNALVYTVIQIIRPFMDSRLRKKMRVFKNLEGDFVFELLQLERLQRPWIR